MALDRMLNFSVMRPTQTAVVCAFVGLLSIASSGWARAQAPTPTPPADALPPADAPPPARADLTAARELVKQGKYPEADQTLAELQTTFPDDPSLLLLRGEILNATGHADQAVTVLRHASEVAPTKKRVQFVLGTALSTLGDSAGALEAFGKELEVNQDPKVASMAHMNRKILLEKEKKYTEAAAEIEAVLSIDAESNKQALGDLADLYFDAALVDDAAKAIDRAEAAGIQSSRLLFRLGVARFNQKSFEASAAAFQRALVIQPDLAPAELNLAKSLDQMGKPDEANAHLRKYLELEPKASEAAEIRKRLAPASSAKAKAGKK